jgi:hypothetical protein
MTFFHSVFLHSCGSTGLAARAKLAVCSLAVSHPRLRRAFLACLLASSSSVLAENAPPDEVLVEDAPVLVGLSESTAAAVFRYRSRLHVVVVEDDFPNGDFRLVRVANNAVLIERLSAAPGTPELTEVQLGQSVQPTPPILRNNVYPLPAAPGESQ